MENQNILSEKSEQLAQPVSIKEHMNVFPSCLTSFLGGMIEALHDKDYFNVKIQLTIIK